MEIGDFLGGVGLFLCIGAIILVAVVAFAFRAITRRSSGRDNVNVFDERGEAVSRYDDRDVKTGGGFGEIPTTGTEYDRDTERRTGMDREAGYDRGIDSELRDDPSSFSGPPPRRDTPRRDEPRRRDEDDDEVRSGGGFGS